MFLGMSRPTWIFVGLLFVLSLALIVTNPVGGWSIPLGILVLLIAFAVFSRVPKRGRPPEPPPESAPLSAPPPLPLAPPPPRPAIRGRDANEV